MRSATITLFFHHFEGRLYRHLERRLTQTIREFLQRTYNLELQKIVVEQPPRVELGEYALTVDWPPGLLWHHPIADELQKVVNLCSGIIANPRTNRPDKLLLNSES